MKLLARVALALGALAACSSALAAPAAAADITSCSLPAIYQPFLGYGDTSFYSPVPGEGYDVFSASGWTLSGGAQVVPATVSDGSEGSVLELPAGAKAVSPPTCVNNAYPYLRTMVRGSGGS